MVQTARLGNDKEAATWERSAHLNTEQFNFEVSVEGKGKL